MLIKKVDKKSWRNNKKKWLLYWFFIKVIKINLDLKKLMRQLISWFKNNLILKKIYMFKIYHMKWLKEDFNFKKFKD